MSRCQAIDAPVTPTLHQREQFCRAEIYGHCPTLRLMLRLGRPLQEEEYWSIWMPPAP